MKSAKLNLLTATALLSTTTATLLLASTITLETDWNLKFPYNQTLNQPISELPIAPKDALDIIYVYDYLEQGSNNWQLLHQ